jgi:hypothetical protein
MNICIVYTGAYMHAYYNTIMYMYICTIIPYRQCLLFKHDRINIILVQKYFYIINPLDAVAPLGDKRCRVRNAMIKIKDIFLGR